ncbi:hypothetical protein ONS95_009493 [Cadophora gregata]|uniref:uncharacterized protein n=1 Tax=Cadophora gregata TaxID=51156 RepID=UPI0026DC3A9A|nr:uncharacterized protein ONS95_009493 [Cadophora gregata]KAK0124545.1 hypothetical protein ONS95_009493 [Cadophora gregata]KAK0129602.1 hypothetical protein ONS96_000168 [Cadophora gregata f. sp. sojae]
MSSDLLAEFDSFYNPSPDKQSATTPASNDLFSLSGSNSTATFGNGGTQQWQAPAKLPVDDLWGDMSSFQPTAPAQPIATSQEDIWGSFEASVPQTQMVQPTSTVQAKYAGWGTTSGEIRPVGVRRSTLDMFSSNIEDIPGPVEMPKPVPKAAPKPVRKPSYGRDVLFDAEAEAEDDDEFGDFETVAAPEPVSQPQPPPSQSLTNMFGATSLKDKPSKRPANLLSSGLTAGGLPYPQAPKSPSFQERNPFGDLAPVLATKQLSNVKKGSRPNSASPVTAWPNFAPPQPDPYEDSPAPDNAEDDWGDFADNLDAPVPAVISPRPTTGIEADAWAWDNADGVLSSPPAEVNEAPPTNIPPPSIILTLFPPLFDLPQSTLFKAVADQPFSLKNRIISDPSTISFLRAYLLIATVAARIIAGRKLRWKRDTLLSQAMKIGPAAAGGKGGMKLTGVDKSEVVREDREAADVVRVWKEQLGRLKSAVAVANTSLKDTATHLAIPEISETMHVKTQEGGLSAPKQCLICGLKREERIAKVDVMVEDSFGEWWVEHWGHRACKNFWQEHESKLKGR